jgi:serine/threonine-protein kinase
MVELGPGLELGGAVRLVEKLGEGGMGSVWVAEHLALRTQVAVKFLAPHMAQDAAAAARFRREATAAARVKSPHIVQIFDHGMSADFGPYIVMELLDGETVSDFVRRHGQLSLRSTVEIVSQLCKALAKAHALGIVHRDIKPDNVFLIDPEREIFIKLLDFGIAKSLNDELSVTSTGTMMGTPHYMSPEQMLSSKHVDFRADLWAVAVLAYHCLTGSVPFDGETFGSIAIAVAQGNFAPPHQLRGVGSLALDAWFVRALSRQPEHRFSSASELADTFAAVVAGQPLGDGTLVLPAAGSTGPRLSLVMAVEPSVARTAPTFAGVATTLSRSGQNRVLAIGAVVSALALGGATLAALLTWKTEPASAPQGERAAAIVPAIVSVPVAAPAGTASAAAVATSASSSVPAVGSEDTERLTPARTPPSPVASPAKSKPKPQPPETTAKPVRPDRGF